MEEEVKALRTMREFISWYEENNNNTIPASLALKLNEFYIKFKYIVEQENEMNEYLKNFLG
ncbi:MAG: hypothetical protein EBR82_83700 [Caulobacteraceae bacterium]|nr:hypothetical protein [Caulobacteraceae bacterium]